MHGYKLNIFSSGFHVTFSLYIKKKIIQNHNNLSAVDFHIIITMTGYMNTYIFHLHSTKLHAVVCLLFSIRIGPI